MLVVVMVDQGIAAADHDFSLEGEEKGHFTVF